MFLITCRKNGVRRSARLTAHALRDQEFMAFSVLARYGSCWNCSNQKLLLEYNVLVQCSYVRNWTWSNLSLGYHKTPKIARGLYFKKAWITRKTFSRKKETRITYVKYIKTLGTAHCAILNTHRVSFAIGRRVRREKSLKIALHLFCLRTFHIKMMSFDTPPS